MINTLKCPLCGGQMTEAKRGFSCSKWKKEDGGCKFTIWKESYGAIFTEEDVAKMLNGEKVRKTNVSKSGKAYEADWYLGPDNKAVFDFAEQEKEEQ